MYKYDLHVHTVGASACARNTVREMMVRYKEIGFSGFALTNYFLHTFLMIIGININAKHCI